MNRFLLLAIMFLVSCGDDSPFIRNIDLGPTPVPEQAYAILCDKQGNWTFRDSAGGIWVNEYRTKDEAIQMRDWLKDLDSHITDAEMAEVHKVQRKNWQICPESEASK